MHIKTSLPNVFFWGLLALFFAITQIMFGNYFGARETVVSIIIFSLLYGYKRCLGIAYLFISFLVAFTYGFVGLSYGHIDKNAVDALLYTNPGEAFEYISSIPPSIFAWYAGLITLFIAIVFFLKNHPDFLKKLNWKTVLSLVCVLLVLSCSTFVKNLFKGNPLNVTDIKMTEVNFGISIFQAFKASSQGQSKYSIFNKSADWQAVSNNDTMTTYVLILGESARRDFFGAYGAPWNNTPWLSSEPGILFSNFISASAGTAPSLSRELYLKSDSENFNPAYNIITLAKSAGFKTFWISAQGERGTADSPISVVAKMADHFDFIADDLNPLNKVIKKTDFDLLEPFKEALLTPGKKLIVLHLMGSHPQACRRTDDQYSEFFHSKELSCYIESLRNTDQLANDVSGLLKARESSHQEKWSLLFTSDHGLDFATDQQGWCLKHMDKRQGSYEVPLFITGSEFKNRENILAQRSGLDFLALTAEWLEISSPKLSENACQWLKDEKCLNQDSVFRYSGEKINFNELPKFSLESFIKDNP